MGTINRALAGENGDNKYSTGWAVDIRAMQMRGGTAQFMLSPRLIFLYCVVAVICLVMIRNIGGRS